MAARYLAAVSRGGHQADDELRRLADWFAKSLGFTVMEGTSRFIATEKPAPIMLEDGGGCILGSVYAVGRHGQISALDSSTKSLVRETGGRHLVDAYWGHYVALVTQPGNAAIQIIRAPFGSLPCYMAETAGIRVAASDLALLSAARAAMHSIDWKGVARYLTATSVHQPQTCLAGVTELLGGQRATLAASVYPVEELWSPWRFATGRIDDPREAVHRVRGVVRSCVAAQAADKRHVLLKLSGGIDSSIVAAALARAQMPYTCMTLVTKDAAGDERRYACQVTERCSVPLLEVYRDVERIDLMRSAASRLPRPTARSFLQESERAVRDAARETGADIVFDGGGGDNVFCALLSVVPVADCLLSSSPNAAFWRSATDIARLADSSLFSVAWRAARRAWFRSARYHWQSDYRFLATDVRQSDEQAVLHPWLDAPKGVLPGQAAHVALMVAAQSYAESMDAETDLPLCAPLLSQPIIETCLRVPSWLWFADGLNRVIAREAFADDLPGGVIWRRSKGTPDGFVAEIFERYRESIRAILLDGLLAGAGILDRAALDREFQQAGPLRGMSYLRIVRLVDVEAWAQARIAMSHSALLPAAISA